MAGRVINNNIMTEENLTLFDYTHVCRSLSRRALFNENQEKTIYFSKVTKYKELDMGWRILKISIYLDFFRIA